ncbi:MAG: beta-lactamase family protein [Planctomycetaceae bacterium]|nr:beta-lactamase family protein [Planctomycetaceae bacterium]
MSVLLWVLLAQGVPGAAWEEKAPADVGLARDKLDALRDLAGGRGCVVRRGALVYTWGDPSRSADVASAAKPLLSTLLMLAVQDGKLDGVDARVSDFEARLTGKNAGITWRQLADQTSGYGLEENPGEAWAYNDFALALYYDTLLGKVYARPGTEVLRQKLAVPLQFQDPVTFEAFGSADRPGRLSISVRDFARFGLLILRGGVWGSTRILSAPLTYLSISAPVPASLPVTSGKDAPMIEGQRTLGGGRNLTPLGPGCYSFNWWLNGMDEQRRQLFVDGPGDLVAALGHGGKRALWILPSRDLVVSWNDSALSDLDRCPGRAVAGLNRAVRLMAEAAN